MKDIKNNFSPLTGLSDAFLIGDSELHVYHTLNVKNPDVLSETVVVFKAKPTCIRQQARAWNESSFDIRIHDDFWNNRTKA